LSEAWALPPKPMSGHGPTVEAPTPLPSANVPPDIPSPDDALGGATDQLPVVPIGLPLYANMVKMILCPLTVPLSDAVVKHGYPVAVIVPVRVALLAPKLALCVMVPDTTIGAGGVTPVNACMYVEPVSVPVKLPFTGGIKIAVHDPVVGVVKHAPPSAW